MTSLRDVMATDPVAVDPDTTIAEAAAVMVGARIGSVLVEDHGAGLGILTERDVLRAAGASGDLLATRVRDWMTMEPATAEPGQDVADGVETMLDGGFRHLPVIDDGEVVGIVSMRALLAALHGAAGQVPREAVPDGGDTAPTESPADVHERRSRMFDATRRLQEQSRTRTDDPERWRRGLGDAVDELVAVLSAHIAETEGSDGFFEELIRESDGRLSPAVRRLGRDHDRSGELIRALRAALEDGDEPSSLRSHVDELFAQLEAHRHRGSDLLWSAYVDEIGVGD